MRAAKADANQPEIVAALRAVGASVLHIHMVPKCADIVVGYRGLNYILEIKDGAKPPSARKLTEGEQEFQDGWRGSVHTVINIGEALAAIGAAEYKLEPPTE